MALPSLRRERRKEQPHLPWAHWGSHQPATFVWCLWNPCPCCAFPEWCLQQWAGTVKQCQPQKIKTHGCEKLVWACDFPIPFICCGVCLMLCTVSKISNVEKRNFEGFVTSYQYPSPKGNPSSFFLLILPEKKSSLHLATSHRKPYGSGCQGLFLSPQLNEALPATWHTKFVYNPASKEEHILVITLPIRFLVSYMVQGQAEDIRKFRGLNPVL